MFGTVFVTPQMVDKDIRDEYSNKYEKLFPTEGSKWKQLRRLSSENQLRRLLGYEARKSHTDTSLFFSPVDTPPVPSGDIASQQQQEKRPVEATSAQLPPQEQQVAKAKHDKVPQYLSEESYSGPPPPP